MDKKLPLFSGAEDADDARRDLPEKADEEDDAEEEDDDLSLLLMGFLYWRLPMARDMLSEPGEHQNIIREFVIQGLEETLTYTSRPSIPIHRTASIFDPGFLSRGIRFMRLCEASLVQLELSPSVSPSKKNPDLRY